MASFVRILFLKKNKEYPDAEYTKRSFWDNLSKNKKLPMILKGISAEDGHKLWNLVLKKIQENTKKISTLFTFFHMKFCIFLKKK